MGIPLHLVPYGYVVYPAAAIVLLTGRSLMARGRPWTPEEDAIVLSTPVTKDSQAALVAGGYGERTENAIKQRRNELRKSDGRGRVSLLGGRTQTRMSDDGSIVSASAAYETALAHRVRLLAELEAAEAAVDDAWEALQRRIDQEKREE